MEDSPSVLATAIHTGYSDRAFGPWFCPSSCSLLVVNQQMEELLLLFLPFNNSKFQLNKSFFTEKEKNTQQGSGAFCLSQFSSHFINLQLCLLLLHSYQEHTGNAWFYVMFAPLMS